MAPRGKNKAATAAKPESGLPPVKKDRSDRLKAVKRERGEEYNAKATMLSFLKYTSTKSKDNDKATAAGEALEIYKSLSDDSDRRQFLAKFDSCGRTTDGLKFALSFKQTLTNDKITKVEVVENFLNRRAPYCLRRQQMAPCKNCWLLPLPPAPDASRTITSFPPGVARPSSVVAP